MTAAGALPTPSTIERYAQARERRDYPVMLGTLIGLALTLGPDDDLNPHAIATLREIAETYADPRCGKRPEPFTDDDGVELVTADGRLTLAGAERLLGEEAPR